MRAKARNRRLARRQQHTASTYDRKATMLRMSIAKAKRQRKGKALVINEMEQCGYTLRYNGDHTDPHDWRRLPSQAPHAALEHS